MLRSFSLLPSRPTSARLFRPTGQEVGDTFGPSPCPSSWWLRWGSGRDRTSEPSAPPPPTVQGPSVCVAASLTTASRVSARRLAVRRILTPRTRVVLSVPRVGTGVTNSSPSRSPQSTSRVYLEEDLAPRFSGPTDSFHRSFESLTVKGPLSRSVH